MQVAGYRVGMIVGGGALLIFHDRLGSSGTFWSMAVLTGLATLPIVLAREPARAGVTRHANEVAIHFLRRPGVSRILLIIVVYKAGDAFATGMLRPFFADAGLSLAEIGWLLGTVGFVAGLVGAVVGGSLVNRFGRRRSLLVFGMAQAAAVAGYALLAAQSPSTRALYVLCAAEHLAGARPGPIACMDLLHAPILAPPPPRNHYGVRAAVTVSEPPS